MPRFGAQLRKLEMDIKKLEDELKIAKENAQNSQQNTTQLAAEILKIYPDVLLYHCE